MNMDCGSSFLYIEILSIFIQCNVGYADLHGIRIDTFRSKHTINTRGLRNHQVKEATIFNLFTLQGNNGRIDKTCPNQGVLNYKKLIENCPK